MMDMKELKKLFLQYQVNKGEEYFSEILFNVDYLILYFMRDCRRRLFYIRDLDLRELYHTSILALYNAVNTFPEKMPERYIPCRIRAYMIAEFKKTYRYLDIESGELDPNDYYKFRSTDSINLDKIDYDNILSTLNPTEASILHDYLSGNKQVQQIAKEQNLSNSSISMKVKKLIIRLSQRENFIPKGLQNETTT